MNILKVRSGKFVELGRNCAVDESSIACRSKYGRHVIVFNSSKPTGKYHFKIYMCCSSESWLMVNFRLHCASDIKERLHGVVSVDDARALHVAIEMSSEVRKHVIEVTRPLHGSNRIVNTDNFYTSTHLLEARRVFGLYGRGTIRENSKHYPRCVTISKDGNASRGEMKQAVCLKRKVVAASWADEAIVNIVSNADPSTTTLVRRQVAREKFTFTAPSCIIQYNQGMQRVDRIDQLSGRISIADGHTFRKWHKKLALAFNDLARCNTYISFKMANKTEAKRDPHRSFMIALASELLDGSWEHTLTDARLRNSIYLSTKINLSVGSRDAKPRR